MKTCSSAVKMVIVICQGHASFATDDSGVSLRVNEHLNNEDRLKRKKCKKLQATKTCQKTNKLLHNSFFFFILRQQ